jgi:lon-related putative ATP-dependent protease
MYKKCIVPVNRLTKQVDLKKYNFNTTKDITSLSTVIGQKRAVSSINFALEIDDASGYNLFVTGSYGTGRTTIVTDLLNKSAQKRKTPSDWIFVYNFQNADEPIALEIPAGKAKIFRQDMQRLINNLTVDLQKVFESKNYLNRKNEIVESVQNKKQNIFSTLEKEALSLNVQIKSSSMGFVTIPLKDGKSIETEDFQKLPQKEQDIISKNVNHVQKRIQEVVRQINLLDRALQDNIEKLNEDVARYVVDNHFNPFIENYQQYKDIKNYLNEAAGDIVNNVYDFINIDEGQNKDGAVIELPYKLDKYKINVVIDNSRQTGAPVIYETNPSYNNLFGRIEKKSFQGYIYTDYTMIKAGSLLAANGGYLIIDADQLLKDNSAYEALKRALRSRQLRIEDINAFYGYSTTTSLKPALVPLNVKVVLVGKVSIYRLLHNYDEEFRKIFKVRADFDNEVKETSDSIRKYIQFIARVVNEEKLLHFDSEGAAAVIEYGFRRSDHQKKMSIQFGEIVRIIREASFWAKKGRQKLVSGKDVDKAIEERIYRHNLVEEKVHESILENTINVDVHGFKVGQINGLAVYNLGDYSFGRPSRITVNTYIGNKGIINIEREAKLSGRIHNKGLLVFSGYFSQKFGASMPLSFSASITFEQSYGTIDGDSASSTELYALLSSLSQIPINQSIAVTGSVNQKGEVQAIGGANEKIEGFFQVCKSRGLTGNQGVIIPKANVKNLLLNNEVVEAVKNNKFNVWAVDHIEDGMRILTGMKCGALRKDESFTKNSIFDKVQERLKEFASVSHKFRKNLDNDSKKEDDEDEDK